MMTAEQAGVVAVMSSGHAILAHLARPPMGDRTLCGRYGSDRYLSPETDVTGVPECKVCKTTEAASK